MWGNQLGDQLDRTTLNLYNKDKAKTKMWGSRLATSPSRLSHKKNIKSLQTSLTLDSPRIIENAMGRMESQEQRFKRTLKVFLTLAQNRVGHLRNIRSAVDNYQ